MVIVRPTFHVPLSIRAYDILLECLTLIDLNWLHANPGTPLLYQSGVIYQRERDGAEDWLPIPLVLEQGWGDCEDLAAFRAAELRYQGLIARAFASRVINADGSEQYHARVRLGNGVIEDPSRKLGM